MRVLLWALFSIRPSVRRFVLFFFVFFFQGCTMVWLDTGGGQGGKRFVAAELKSIKRSLL